MGRAVRRGRPPPRAGRLDRHRRDPPAPRPRPGPVRPGDGPGPRPLQRVPVRADHAAAGRSGPPRGRPPDAGPAGIETHRPRRHAQLPDQAGRRRPARRRRTRTRPAIRWRAARAAHRVTPPGNVRRPAPGSTRRPQPRYRHRGGTDPAPHGAARPPARRCQPHSGFRQPCALNGRRAPPGRCASRSPAAVTSGTDDPAHRTLHADPPESSARFRRPCRRRDQAAGRITLPACRSARRRRPRAGAGTRREKAGPGAHSAPPAIPYSFPYTCRHRNPPDPGMRRQCPE